MILTADYHTHTVFSHGKGTILDNAMQAKAMGLKEIAISDHGFSHPAFGITGRKVPEMRRLCDEATKETGVKVLLGIESNLLGKKGGVDLKPKYYEYFDVFLAGAHRFILFESLSAWFGFFGRNFFTAITKKKPSKGLIKTTTKAYINAIKKHPIDAITHLNYLYYADAVEVAKCARDYGTYIELNAKKTHLSDEQLAAVRDTGVQFIIGSDAHAPQRVGEISLVEKTLSRVEIPAAQIANIDGKTPSFRFAEYKTAHGMEIR